MILFKNLDLLSVGISVVAIGVLGFIVFFNNKRSVTNQSFLFFSLVTIIWGVSNYFNSYPFTSPKLLLWILRMHIFISTWYAFILFHFIFVFPQEKKRFPKWYVYFLVPAVILTSVLTLTPLVFSKISEIAVPGEVTNPERGQGIIIFVLVAAGLVFGSIYLLFKKTLAATGAAKKQLIFVFVGTLITYLLIIIFNLILPVVLNNLRYIPLGATFIIPFAAFTAYAIVKYRLLNVRVVATELFTFALWLTLLIITLRVSTTEDMILHAVVFVATVVLGIFLIRSVLQEVKMRERMTQLAADLEITNRELKTLDEAKSDFISIASHQLRTPLSIIKGYMSMIREGTYGKVDPKLDDPIHKVYVSNERLINLVSDLLDLSRMERGKMQYEFVPVRLGEIAEGIVLDFEKVATDKGLKFNWLKVKGNDLVKGDANKLRQIILNLIDNAIKYTAAGSLTIGIEEVPGRRVRFYVTDTGPGLTPEEVHALFQKFSRGQTEKTVHTEGLGLGLYVAKLIAQAHGGDLLVTSPGKGRGSTFSLTLPLYSEATENFTKFTSEI